MMRAVRWPPGTEVPISHKPSKWTTNQLQEIIAWIEGPPHRTVAQAAEHFGIPRASLAQALTYWTQQMRLGRFPSGDVPAPAPSAEARALEQLNKPRAPMPAWLAKKYGGRGPVE